MPPEIRIDQLTGLRTILASDRAERPGAFAERAIAQAARPEEACPLCEGNERLSPPELWAERAEGSAPGMPGWLTRAVPNRYPAVGAVPGEAAPIATGGPETGLASSVDPLGASTRGAGQNLFGSQPAAGSHELIVSCPEHRTSLGELSEPELERAVAAWRARMALRAGESASTSLIVNEGREAGATLSHSHAQLLGLGFVPAELARERERAAAYHERTMGGHLLGDVATEEVRRRERLVAIDDDSMLICPWASRRPYELRVVPRRVAPRFEDDTAGAGMIATGLRALAGRLGAGTPLNLWIRTAPRDAEEFCWHVDLAPRLAVEAGFELGSGVTVNIVAPERAAAELREALGPRAEA